MFRTVLSRGFMSTRLTVPLVRPGLGRVVKKASVLRYLGSASMLRAEQPPPQPPKDPNSMFRIQFRNARDDPKAPKPPQGPQGPDWRTVLTYGFATAFIFTLVFNSMSRDSHLLSWQEFRTSYLDQGLVERIILVNKTQGRAILKQHQFPRVVFFTVGSVELFDQQYDEAMKELNLPGAQQVPVSYTNETSLGSILMTLLPTALLIGGLWYLMRRGLSGAGSGGIFNMGKSTAKKFNEEKDIKITFKDVAGCDEAKAEIMEFVNFLKEPKKYEELGAKIPRGAILSGPPGTGKTLLAKATAGEAGVPFYSVSGSEFVEMFVGVGASRVRDLFSTARKEAPSIVFIDEIDAIGRARSPSGSFGGGHDEREATLNQILVEMDGFATNEHVVVLAGTNRPDILDKALMRPGRFSRHITVDKPDVNGRKQIYDVYLKRIRTNLNLDTLAQRLAALTPGFAGADIANCVNEAALIAARGNNDSVEWTHFDQAVERTSFGLEKKSKILTPEERRTIAYHEAGHAICGWYLEHTDPLVKVTIIPRGESLGYAKYLPADVPLPSNVELEDRMVMALGGRVAEELNFNSSSSGAASDFQKVTQIATNMVAQWGMSPKVGYVNYDEQEGYYTKPFSESTAAVIDQEVHRIVNHAYEKCRALLSEKAEQVKAIAEELLKKESLDRADFVRLIGKRPFEDNSIEFKYLQGEGVIRKDDEASEPKKTESD
ncbi:Mitochondrial respiratory chain complexes assembly protein YTA12 [Wickerhamiella sorbophila]|uniref:Mitochondrial respiratory chain complexes assembly protein YTA12 n=1 Tax=Wickerhamiella sorbophila TaxID=45607 RepID=A0A2T0FKJ3_9ASCO|nr:Mitochondrial respiratory chain complexes assembly protein YTA12 [Wickerhamiella sorbophila]PRT55500.1 Mitochondrial respiratory chain complexes assembly protein YTA12 [Wickerhamiella sorbophila]